jgi:hypothetical protein
MDRRAFLQTGIACGSAWLLPRTMFGSQGCGQAVTTPYGSVQRCTAGIKSVALQPVQSYQQRNEWCWAACISMVFAYYGHRVSQQRIVKEVWGQVVNMPGLPGQILSDLNRAWDDDGGKRFTSRGDSLSANAFNAVKDLENDQPLIIGAMGHAMVLTALTGDSNAQTGAWQIVEAVVRDPWPGNGGRRLLSPAEWRQINFAARIRVQ